MTATSRKFKMSKVWFYFATFFGVCGLVALMSIWYQKENINRTIIAQNDFRFVLNMTDLIEVDFNKPVINHNIISKNTMHSNYTTKVIINFTLQELTRSKSTRLQLDLKAKLPTCLILGVRKAGTRALLEYLSLHPSIVASKKETHFFDSDENYNRGLSWYLNFMPPSLPGQITIEKTPAYFLSHKVPPRIRNSLLPFVEKMKFLVVVKDPIERALSDYVKVKNSKLKLGIQYLTFEELSTDPISGNLTSLYKPIIRSLYSLQLKNWLKYFSIDQFRFVSGESLIRNPALELEGVERFLGIPRYLTPDKFLYNETRGFYCMVFRRQQNCPNNADRIKTITPTRSYSRLMKIGRHEIPTSSPELNSRQLKDDGRCRNKKNNILRHNSSKDTSNGEIKCLSSSKGLKHPTLDVNFLKRLREFFYPYNREFYNITGINFGW